MDFFVVNTPDKIVTLNDFEWVSSVNQGEYV